MDTILFCNPWEGLSFMLQRSLKRENIEMEFKNLKDDLKIFLKYGVKSCPLLLVLDNKEVVDRISSVEEIVNYLKEQNESVN